MKQKRKWFLMWCLLLPLAVMGQTTIKGTVVDATNEPLIGVTVQVAGQMGGTVTDFDGNYTIKVENDDVSLKFSYIGYKDQVIPVKGKTVINVTMKEDSEVLEEVVVVGYGTQKKESLTGAVTVVDAKAFEQKGGLSSPLQALQGQVAGVIITRSSSAPGDESWSMNLRGASSMNATEPLVIIDGVAANSVADMRLLNSNDIESINFLKDGSAAIYGSRAAGGVVLITTKKGKEGKVRIDYGGSATYKVVGLMPQLMNLEEWATGLQQTLLNDNMPGDVWMTYADLALKYEDYYIDLQTTANPFGGAAFTDVQDFVFDKNVDWLGALFGPTWSTNHSVSVSGGNEKSAFRISGNYLYDGSTLRYGKNNNQRFNLRLTHSYQLNKIFTLESNIAYSRQEQVAPTLVSSALTTSMPQPGLPLRAIDGKPYAWGTWGSPVAKIEEGGDNRLSVSSINISETLKAKITDWLDGNINLGYNTSEARRKTIQNPITYYNYAGNTVTLQDPSQEKSYFQQTSSRTDFYSVSGYLNAHKTFKDKHNVSVMLGTQYELKDMEMFGARYTDILQGLDVINGSGTLTLSDNTNGSYNYRNSIMSFFGRINYDFDSRYLLEVNLRYDGSSKFQPENRWDFFWGASIGWRINQEKFLRNVSWINNLKLRASYAEMGNQSGISNYDGFQFYNLQSLSGAYVGADRLTYIRTSGTFASTDRKWERIKNYNVALDFGLNILGGNLSGTVEGFMKRNDNMLVAMTYPAILGDKAPTANAGKFKDWGFEGQVTYNGHIGKDINWHIGGTMTFARNELTDYGGTNVIKSGYTSTQQGYSLNSIFGMRYGGKIQDEAMLKAYLAKYYTNNGIGMPANLRVGDNMFCDENGDGVLDYRDYIYLGSDAPEISYSFNIGASWKGFDINIVFQGAANRFVYRGIDNWTVPFRNRYSNFTSSSIGNTWSVDNPDAYYSPYTLDANIISYNYQASSLTAQDARYLRLKDVTIGYQVPTKLLLPLRVVQSARVYFTGNDLWETTKIKDGWDPEASRNASGTGRYPFTRNFTFGLNLGF